MYTNNEGQTKTIETFNVTRDGWYGIGTDKKGNAILHNRSADPKNDATYHIINRHAEQYGQGTPSFTISDIYSPFPKQYNSTFIENGQPGPALPSVVKRQGDYDQGAEFHVGGWFITTEGNKKLAGTYGCFSIIDPNQVKKTVEDAIKNNEANTKPSNDEMKMFAKDLKSAENEQKKDFGKSKSTEITINKRQYDEVKTVPNHN